MDVCGFGYALIGIILADPDRHPGPADSNQDPYPFQTNVKLNNIFFQKISLYYRFFVLISAGSQSKSLLRVCKHMKILLLNNTLKDFQHYVPTQSLRRGVQ